MEIAELQAYFFYVFPQTRSNLICFTKILTFHIYIEFIRSNTQSWNYESCPKPKFTICFDLLKKVFSFKNHNRHVTVYFYKKTLYELKNLIAWKNSELVQGVSTQTCILHFTLAGRNSQASFGLKVNWEFWIAEFLLMTLGFGQK